MAVAIVVGKHRKLEEEEEELAAEADENGEEKIYEEIPAYLAACVELTGLKHMDHGQFSLLKIEDVKELFETLGTNRDDKVCLSKIKDLLQKIMKPPFTDEEVEMLFGQYVGEDGRYEGAFISSEEFLSVFQQENDEMTKLKSKRRDVDQNVTKEYFVENIVRIVDRDDAFMTLPITVVYMVFFIYLVQGHLRIFERRNQENALEEFTNGRDPRETADENVDDIDSLWEWIEGAGLRAPLGNVKNNTAGTYSQCVLASRNVLIGDVKLTKTLDTGASESVWLLNTAAAQAHLLSHPHAYQDAALAAAAELKGNGWDKSDIRQMSMSFGSYNEFSRMFAITTVTIPLPEFGNVWTRIDSSAVSVEPYPGIMLYIADSLFFALAFWIGFNESKDAFAALRMGCGEFRDYLAFWNVVDWVNIILCVLFGICWLDTIRFMIDEKLHGLIDDKYVINVDVMKLDATTMDALNDALLGLRLRYWFMQITMASNTVSVVMKFFKSFESNARLSVVASTFKRAFVDLVHFFIMFSTIFLPFVIIGHILFGSDIQDFASVTSSINTGICALMGDFQWYIEEQPTYFTSALPSGMPRMVVMIWYVSFMFLVFLVLLNMLLAVVLEYYTIVSGEVQYAVDAPAIWQQASRYIAFKKETRGFVPLEDIRGDLENDDDPAHPEESVTVKTLLDAWGDKRKMSEAQAAWLMDMLDQHNAKGLEQEQKKQKAQHVKHLAEENKEKLMELSGSILENSARLVELEGVAGGASDISASLDKLADLVTDLNVSVSKVRKEHDRLAVKVEDMMGAIPEGHRLELVEGAPVAGGGGDSAAPGRRAREWKKAAPASKTNLGAPTNSTAASPGAKTDAPASSRRDLRKATSAEKK